MKIILVSEINQHQGLAEKNLFENPLYFCVQYPKSPPPKYLP